MTFGAAAATVRPARSGDAASLAALECECFGVDAWSTAAVDGELAGVPDRRHVVVAECGDRIVGYASLVLAPDVADIGRVAVAPAARRAGTGRRLTETLLAEADRRGCQRVLLEVAADNAPAIGLYEALGFVAIDRRVGYYGAGRDALVLQRAGLV